MKKNNKLIKIFLIIVILCIIGMIVYNIIYSVTYSRIHFHFPFDYERAYNKGAGTSKYHITRSYEELQDKYRKLMCKYLNTKLSLDDLNRELEENGHNTKYQIKKDNIFLFDDHKYFKDRSKLNSDYIYLKNTFFIEHMNKEDIAMLKNNKADIDMIDRTYKLVIDSYEGNGNGRIVSYVKGEIPMRTLSSDIVLFYDFDIWNESNDREKQMLLNETLAKYEKKFSGELKYPVKIINIADMKQWILRD